MKKIGLMIVLWSILIFSKPVSAKVIYSMNDLPETKSIVADSTLKAPEVTAPCGTKLRNIVFPANQNWYWIIDYNSLDKKVSIDKKTYVKAVYIKKGTSTGKIVSVPVKVFEDLRYHHYKKPTSEKAGNYTYYNCQGCGKYYNKNKKKVAANSYIIPVIPSSKEVIMGKTTDISKIITDGSKAFSKVSVDKKYKNYLNVSGRKLKLYSEFKKGLPSEIPVTIEMKDAERASGKRYYRVNIKVTPSVEITTKPIRSGTMINYYFKYNYQGATKVKIRATNLDSKVLNDIFDTYMTNPVSNSDCWFTVDRWKLNQIGGSLTFKITVFYGNNEKITRTITK